MSCRTDDAPARSPIILLCDTRDAAVAYMSVAVVGWVERCAMASRTRSEERRRRARRPQRSQTIAPSPMNLPRAAFGTTERVPTGGEQFLAEHPELGKPFSSPYNPYVWLDPARSPARVMVAQGEVRGWPRRGMIVVLRVMLIGIVGGVAQMVGAVSARSGIWGQAFLLGLLLLALSGLQAFAFARRLLARRRTPSAAWSRRQPARQHEDML